MEDKGYYYLKLKEGFFESDELKILESMDNGYLYSNILLKLYLKSLRSNGRLTLNDFIPYDEKMLSIITGHNVDVVRSAIKIFQELHLIEILDNGVIYISDIQKLIGSISSEGIRKREYRERIEREKEERTMLGQSPDIISISHSNSVLHSDEFNNNTLFENSYRKFIRDFQINEDNYSAGKLAEMDFDRLYKAYSETPWLRINFRSLTKICQKYELIIGEYYVKYRQVSNCKSDNDRKYTKSDFEALIADPETVEFGL